MPTPDTNADPAPIPWLGKGSVSPETDSQPWRIAGSREEIIGLQYRYHPVDYMRCYTLLIFLRWRPNAWLALCTAGFATLGIVLIFMRGTGITASSIVTGLVVLLVSFVVVYVLTLLVTLFTLPFYCVVLLLLRRKPTSFILEITGVSEKTLRRSVVKWSQIREIVEEKGDIHFVGRTLFAEGLSVPRTAFADHTAAQRFYAIAVDLWKANGNPSTVSPEARAEFPPPRILP